METTVVSKESLELLKRKAKIVGGIAIDAAMKQIGDEGTVKLSVGIGFVHGVLCGSVKRGFKASLVVLGACAGASVVKNVAQNWDVIKKQ